MSYGDGRVHAGKWTAGANIGDRVTANGGVTWQGEIFSSDKNTLLGVIICAADEHCRDKVGSFVIGAGSVPTLSGPGVEHLKDGRTIKGNWKNDLQDGYGAELDAAGHIVEQGLYHEGSL
jgi:hypothetical protein